MFESKSPRLFSVLLWFVRVDGSPSMYNWEEMSKKGKSTRRILFTSKWPVIDFRVSLHWYVEWQMDRQKDEWRGIWVGGRNSLTYIMIWRLLEKTSRGCLHRHRTQKESTRDCDQIICVLLTLNTGSAPRLLPSLRVSSGTSFTKLCCLRLYVIYQSCPTHPKGR